MSRKYGKYKKYYRYGSIFKLTKAERTMFDIIYEISKTICISIIAIFKATVEISHYVRRMVINFFALKKIGYNLNELLDEIYKMTPRQFEIFVAELFKQHGHKVRLTPPSNDYGRDVIVDDKTFIECKHFAKDNFVGRQICQKLLGSVQMFRAEKAIIVTTGKIHKNAYEVASKVDNLQLMDIADIQEMLLDLEPEQISKVMMRTLNAS